MEIVNNNILIKFLIHYSTMASSKRPLSCHPEFPMALPVSEGSVASSSLASYYKRSAGGYSSVTGCVLIQAIRPALQNLRVFMRKMKDKSK